MMDINTVTKNQQQGHYVPVHRRTGSQSDTFRNGNGIGFDEDDRRMSLNNNKSNRRSEEVENRRASRNWSHRQSKASFDEDGISDLDNSIPSTPATANHRFSMRLDDSHSRRSSSTDKLHAALENLSLHDAMAGEQENWEELLRQYDRYDDSEDASRQNRRSSKRASRLMDPFMEPPAEVPLVDEPTVILDCHDFPAAFKTHHLHDIFREYENTRGGYRIKWMDDTRALIIFEHPATAKKAYIDNVSNPLAKIRPYNGPTDFLRSPPASQQQPAMRRPASVDMKRLSYNGLKSPRFVDQRQSLRGTEGRC
ncbi:hypothetical protein BCR43DRAFT_494604 [Syncephalastrum racemosum]|uniref:Thc1 RRM domain-containing protein n=1 Tax=Syncephalastrum racemosum TaxID=13706 RepID=A0A1X2H8A9_SYNRA|nr:hypothetical protein BCR43DRAFT_494604 [Syncephalastrum racemosum]